MTRKKVQKTENAYHAHRERQRQRILDAVWKLFGQRGIDRVTMAEITSASGVQPSTIYQYFANKDDIVWALLRETMQDFSGRVKHTLDAAPNALARITALFDFMADELENNRAKIRFMAQFDAMYAHDWPAKRLITLESQINPDGFKVFSDLIRDGIADGSLRRDLDPNLTLHAVINGVIGAQRRLASLGNKIEREYGKPADRLFRESIRVILLGLRNPEFLAPRRPKRPRKAGKVRNRKRPS